MDAAGNGAGAGRGNELDLPAGGGAGLRVVYPTHNAKLADGVNAGERKKCEIGAAVNVVSAVDLPVIFLSAVVGYIGADDGHAHLGGRSTGQFDGLAGVPKTGEPKHARLLRWRV